jgi:Flp pilus assembly protein TadB
MSPVGAVVLLTAVGVAGAVLALSGWLQPMPSLLRLVDRLQHAESAARPIGSETPRVALMVKVVGFVRSEPRLLPSSAQLSLVGRTTEQHVIWLVVATVGGFVVPGVVLATLQFAGFVGLGWFVPLCVALGCAAIAPIVVHGSTVERASSVRTDLRYQVSAYLDVVTMQLAGNSGYEGALEHGAAAGDGRLFYELRRRMRESGARGTSLTDALERTGRELGLDELEQIAATAALSAAEGAPVARTLAAKCATLRSALSAEQESEARLRTSRLTAPIVGMALIFMGLVIYPALSLS